MLKRTLAAAVLLLLLVAAMYFGGLFQACAFTLFTLISVFEMGNIYKQKTGRRPFLWGIYPIAASYYFIRLFFDGPSISVILAMFVLGILITMTERVLNEQRKTEDTIYSLMVFIYPMLLYVILMNAVTIGDYALSRTALLIVFAGPLMGDTVAYFVGSFFGKHKLCEHLSPKKTVEGSIGGLAGGALGGFIVHLLQPLWKGPVPLLSLVIMGFVCGAVGQIGDLFASAIKRWAGVKDYGGIIPGHGGIMDRFDSVLMSASAVFVYFYVVS